MEEIIDILYSNITLLDERLTNLTQDVAINEQNFSDFATASDNFFLVIMGALVFFMHAGFTMLEAGAVASRNVVNILFKNVMTVSIGAIGYFLLGYGFAYGTDNNNNSNKFIGNGGYGLAGVDKGDYAFWFFQMVFAATCATIVSGAVAERTKLEAYLVVALYLVCFTYPIVSHWIWSGEGFLSAFQDIQNTLFYSEDKHACGMIDFAGSGVVHMVGGFSGLVGAIFVGPRRNRFEITATGKFGKILPLPAHNLSLCAIGTFILWFGWFGFNSGSTLSFQASNISALVAINTTLSPAMACITGVAIQFAVTHRFDLGVALNTVLGGLVAITAGCSVVEPWMSLFIGIIAALVYLGASAAMKAAKLDDPLDAVAVHGCCGMWGVLVPGIFGVQHLIEDSYGCIGDLDNNNFSLGLQFGTQLVGILCIILWTVGTTIPIFLLLKVTMGLRVSDHAEEVGLDESEHGAQAYELGAIDNETRLQEDVIKKARSKNAQEGPIPGLDGAEQVAKLDEVVTEVTSS